MKAVVQFECKLVRIHEEIGRMHLARELSSAGRKVRVRLDGTIVRDGTIIGVRKSPFFLLIGTDEPVRSDVLSVTSVRRFTLCSYV